ncbi:hypothetical protein PR048_002034 [Dryococelus australis]|uniref:Uncharacterized protein n=1 Tax=Dryococelus australis TaxID=614101 RepID=A0ABQ9IJ04_9NEOP|nr:hypothetical protein PR048_002034 [Dryococelus australis]
MTTTLGYSGPPASSDNCHTLHHRRLLVGPTTSRCAPLSLRRPITSVYLSDASRSEIHLKMPVFPFCTEVVDHIDAAGTEVDGPVGDSDGAAVGSPPIVVDDTVYVMPEVDDGCTAIYDPPEKVDGTTYECLRISVVEGASMCGHARFGLGPGQRSHYSWSLCDEKTRFLFPAYWEAEVLNGPWLRALRQNTKTLQRPFLPDGVTDGKLLTIAAIFILQYLTTSLDESTPDDLPSITTIEEYTRRSTAISAMLCLLIVIHIDIRRSVKVLFVDHWEASAGIAARHSRLGLEPNNMKIIDRAGSRDAGILDGGRSSDPLPDHLMCPKGHYLSTYIARLPLPDFHERGSCGTMPLVVDFFFGDLPFHLLLDSGAAPFSPHFAPIVSQDIDVKSRPNLSPQLDSVLMALEHGVSHVSEVEEPRTPASQQLVLVGRAICTSRDRQSIKEWVDPDERIWHVMSLIHQVRVAGADWRTSFRRVVSQWRELERLCCNVVAVSVGGPTDREHNLQDRECRNVAMYRPDDASCTRVSFTCYCSHYQHEATASACYVQKLPPCTASTRTPCSYTIRCFPSQRTRVARVAVHKDVTSRLEATHKVGDEKTASTSWGKLYKRSFYGEGGLVWHVTSHVSLSRGHSGRDRSGPIRPRPHNAHLHTSQTYLRNLQPLTYIRYLDSKIRITRVFVSHTKATVRASPSRGDGHTYWRLGAASNPQQEPIRDEFTYSLYSHTHDNVAFRRILKSSAFQVEERERNKGDYATHITCTIATKRTPRQPCTSRSSADWESSTSIFNLFSTKLFLHKIARYTQVRQCEALGRAIDRCVLGKSPYWLDC